MVPSRVDSSLFYLRRIHMQGRSWGGHPLLCRPHVQFSKLSSRVVLMATEELCGLAWQVGAEAAA